MQFTQKATTLNSDIYFADQEISKVLDCSLQGNYQQKNIKTALKALDVLETKGFSISQQQLKKGLLSVQKNTGLRGRWELLSKSPNIICDTAHNKEGLTLVIDQLQQQAFKTLHIVLGVLAEKSLDSFADIFPKKANYYFCQPNIPRAMDVELLTQNFNNMGFKGQAYESVLKAFETAKEQALKEDLIFVGGSTFVVAEVL